MQTSANGCLSSHEQLQEFYLDLLRGRFAWIMFPSLQGMLVLLQLSEMTVGVATNQETPRLDS